MSVCISKCMPPAFSLAAYFFLMLLLMFWQDGAISRISVVDHGSGYREGSEVSIIMGWGGVACEGYEISPYLVVAPQYPTKIMSADSAV